MGLTVCCWPNWTNAQIYYYTVTWSIHSDRPLSSIYTKGPHTSAETGSNLFTIASDMVAVTRWRPAWGWMHAHGFYSRCCTDCRVSPCQRAAVGVCCLCDKTQCQRMGAAADAAAESRCSVCRYIDCILLHLDLLPASCCLKLRT